MRKYFCLILIVALLSIQVLVASPELPDPGITPDSPWRYRFKRFFENLVLLLTTDEEGKVQRLLQYAEKRLSEIKAMAEAGKTEYVDDLIEDYELELSLANEIAGLVENATTKEDLFELVALATAQHLEVLDFVQDLVPEQAKEKIALAKKASIKGNKAALRALASINPERCAEIAMNVSKRRLERAREMVEKGESELVTEAITEYEQYAEFGEEIIAIAQEVGENVSKVQELVEEATSIHLTILEEISRKVSSMESKSAIELVEKKAEGVLERILSFGGNQGEIAAALGMLGGGLLLRRKRS